MSDAAGRAAWTAGARATRRGYQNRRRPRRGLHAPQALRRAPAAARRPRAAMRGGERGVGAGEARARPPPRGAPSAGGQPPQRPLPVPPLPPRPTGFPSGVREAPATLSGTRGTRSHPAPLTAPRTEPEPDHVGEGGSGTRAQRRPGADKSPAGRGFGPGAGLGGASGLLLCLGGWGGASGLRRRRDELSADGCSEDERRGPRVPDEDPEGGR